MKTVIKRAVIIAAAMTWVGAAYAQNEVSPVIKKAVKASENKATMIEAINETAINFTEALKDYTNKNDGLAAVQSLTANNNLGGWLVADDVNFNGKSQFLDKSALSAASANVVLPRQFKAWFAPIDAELKVYNEDLALRLFAVGNLAEFARTSQLGAEIQQVTQSEMALHYLIESRQAQFARLLSERISENLKSNYPNAEAFKADFVRVLLSIPPEQIKGMFSEARMKASGEKFLASFNLYDTTTEQWQEGSTAYKFNSNEGFSIEQNGKPQYGMGFINGKYSTVELSAIGQEEKIIKRN